MSEITKDDIENLTDDLRCTLETLRRNRHSDFDEERAVFDQSHARYCLGQLELMLLDLLKPPAPQESLKQHP